MFQDTYPIPPVLGVAFHKASTAQRLAHMEALRGVLIECEKWICRQMADNPKLQTQAMRSALLEISRAIESTPLNF